MTRVEAWPPLQPSGSSPALSQQDHAPGGFDTVLSDMLHFTSGINDVDLSIELASTALHIATGYYFDKVCGTGRLLL